MFEVGGGDEAVVGAGLVVVFRAESISMLDDDKNKHFMAFIGSQLSPTEFLKSHFSVGSEQPKSESGFAKPEKVEKQCSDPRFCARCPQA